jgi:hypothetical protein
MANHRIDPRHVKIHFAYSVAEAAKVLGTHRNTIRLWIKQGLPVADDQRPVVMSGAVIRLSWSGAIPPRSGLLVLENSIASSAVPLNLLPGEWPTLSSARRV